MLQDLSKKIALELEEDTDRTKLLIMSALHLLGQDRVFQVVEEAKQKYGTLYISDGSRLKTLCGCFFHSLTFDEMKKVRKQYLNIKKKLKEMTYE